MYVKIQSNCVYKNTIIVVGVFTANNHHVRAIVMIHHFPSHCQGCLYLDEGLKPDY